MTTADVTTEGPVDPTHYHGTFDTTGTGGRGAATTISHVVDIYPTPEEREGSPEEVESLVPPDARGTEIVGAADDGEEVEEEERAPISIAAVPAEAHSVEINGVDEVEADEVEPGNIDTTDTGAPTPGRQQHLRGGDGSGLEPGDGSDAGGDTPYAKMTKPELQDELEHRQLPRGGNKDDLIARLEEDDAAK